MKKEDKKMVSQKKGEKKEGKKSYSAPDLMIHGDVRKITKALGSGTKDGITGSILL